VLFITFIIYLCILCILYLIFVGLDFISVAFLLFCILRYHVMDKVYQV